MEDLERLPPGQDGITMTGRGFYFMGLGLWVAAVVANLGQLLDPRVAVYPQVRLGVLNLFYQGRLHHPEDESGTVIAGFNMCDVRKICFSS